MGTVADFMLDGILCEKCGICMDDLEDYQDDDGVIRTPPGHPRLCEDCKKE
jgi:hypothetical protein